MAAIVCAGRTPRAESDESVFDQISRRKNIGGEKATLPTTPKTQPKSEGETTDTVTGLHIPPEALLLDRQEDVASSAPAEKKSTVAKASASAPITDSPYLDSESDDFCPTVDIPLQVGPMDSGYEETLEDFEERPRLLGKTCELVEYLRRPMQGQSWLSRPLSVGLEFGGIWGDELITARVRQTSGPLFMGTFGWDHSNWDGYEIRVGGSTIDTFNERPPLQPRNTRFTVFDFSALLYPFGDARLRPFGRIGIGLHNYKFVNDQDQGVNNIIPAAVLGVGVKYLFARHVALRMEFLDNIGWGDGLDLETLHNTSLTFGAEFRFGGHHKLYWPWHSGRMIW